MRAEQLLPDMLAIAVPLWAERMADWITTDYATVEARTVVDLIASQGDDLLFRRDGNTARIFNALAEAVAMASFAPGGITVFSLHFEHHAQEVA